MESVIRNRLSKYTVRSMWSEKVTNGKIYVFEVKIIIKLQKIFAKPRTKLETKKANKDLKRFCLKEKIAEL